MTDASPIEQRRGFDPEWWEQQLSWITIQAEAPCEVVTETLAKWPEIDQRLGDPLDPRTRIPPRDLSRAVFVYQFRGHAWTLLEPVHNGIYFDAVERLSQTLSTRVAAYLYEDVGGAGGCFLYDRGRETRSRMLGAEPDDAIAQFALDLDLFVPHGVWDIDARTAAIRLNPPFAPQEILRAEVFLAKS